MSSMTRGLIFEIARVTLEFESPFLIGTGSGDDLHDTAAVTDANGLPVLPGTSLAGVLRHAARDVWGEEGARVDRAFGFQRNNKGQASGVEVSFGQVHDANNRPVPFIHAHEDDDVLALLRAGLIRDHVRIDGRGAVDRETRGKFDAWMVPAGARFTFELLIHDGAGTTAAELVGLLASPGVRIGSRTRRGLGRFKVIQALARRFDLQNDADWKAYQSLGRGLHEPLPAGVLSPLSYQAASSKRYVVARLELHPESWWMFGGGDPVREEHKSRGSFVDRVNVHEPRIVWDGARGRVTDATSEPDVLPGTGLKGALRHRVAYHARRLTKQWATPDCARNLPDADPVVRALFGAMADNGEGLAGRIAIDDGRIEGSKQGVLDHVSLDRFTQGPMPGLLFNEGPRHGGTLHFELTVDTRPASEREPSLREAKHALKAALEDLIQGRLAFGASGSRGHGFVTGTIEWDDHGAWLEDR